MPDIHKKSIGRNTVKGRVLHKVLKIKERDTRSFKINIVLFL